MDTKPPLDLPDPPRRLRRRSDRGCYPLAGLWFMRLFLLPHTIAGFGLLAAAVWSILVWLFGTDVPGRIANLEITHGKSGKHYQVRLAYTFHGMDYPGSTTVSQEVHETLQIGIL